MTDNTVKQILKEIKHEIIDENKDSIEIGSATKGGKIKIYGNMDNKVEFKRKIDKAVELRQYANMRLEL